MLPPLHKVRLGLRLALIRLVWHAWPARRRPLRGQQRSPAPASHPGRGEPTC